MNTDRREVDGTHRQYDWSDVPPVVAIVESIAVFEHGDPSRIDDALDSPLGRYIDTDALAALLEGDNPVTASFTTPDHRIEISGGTVSISSLDDGSDSSE